MTSSLLQACAICGSQQFKSARLITSNIDGALNGEYRVLTCGTCGAGFTDPAPSFEELELQYASDVYQHSGGRAFGLIDHILSQMQGTRLREIARWCRPPGRLLDVGCGKGRFLYSAAQHGWQVQGTEFSPNQAANARGRYQVQVFEGELSQAKFASESFDVVTAWHVLEHVRNPSEMVIEVRRILRPGGLLIVEVPNYASWQSRLGGKRWFHLDVPRHLTHFSPTALERLLHGHGLRVVERRFFSLELGPFGMLQTMLNRVGLPPNWLYRWLKRSVPYSQPTMVALNGVALAVLGLPAVGLELLAVLFQAGGVVRVMAVRE